MVTIDSNFNSEREDPAVARSAARGSDPRSHRDLLAWRKAYALGLDLYAASRSFPSEEAFGLTSQLRRAAVAVASNIAEGRGRDAERDFIRFLRIAKGSLAEIDTQLRFAQGLEYLPPGRCGLLIHQVDDCRRAINDLIGAVKRGLNAGAKSAAVRRAARPRTLRPSSPPVTEP
jgi:four helix bundle protein